MADLKLKEKCPICGMDVTTDKVKAEFKDHTYYFCSESDRKTFMGAPEKYISKVKAA